MIEPQVGRQVDARAAAAPAASSLAVRGEDGQRGGPAVRRLTGGQLAQDAAERVQVAATVDGQLAVDFNSILPGIAIVAARTFDTSKSCSVSSSSM